MLSFEVPRYVLNKTIRAYPAACSATQEDGEYEECRQGYPRENGLIQLFLHCSEGVADYFLRCTRTIQHGQNQRQRC